MFEEPLPSPYPERAAALMKSAASVIDLDTVGGECLLEMQESRPAWMAV
jgi:hypothetical protein